MDGVGLIFRSWYEEVWQPTKYNLQPTTYNLLSTTYNLLSTTYNLPTLVGTKYNLQPTNPSPSLSTPTPTPIPTLGTQTGISGFADRQVMVIAAALSVLGFVFNLIFLGNLRYTLEFYK